MKYIAAHVAYSFILTTDVIYSKLHFQTYHAGKPTHNGTQK